MISRIVNLSTILGKQSSALFLGARGLGKTKLSEAWLKTQPNSVAYNLLDPEEFKRLLENPNRLRLEVTEKLKSLPPSSVLTVFIDEIQKVPELFDVAHLMLEEFKNRVRFLLTGSSARKLKSSGVNLLASRAISARLHPFTSYELKSQGFNLIEALQLGTVPAIVTAENKAAALRSYVDTYLKEEIQQEALVRKLDKFFSFIDVAAQLNGEIVNFSKMARQLSLSDKTIGDYFQILIDTLLVIKIPGWDKSPKKQVIKSPKFYFFDCGVLNAASRELNLQLSEGSSGYGRLFETLVINEIYRLNDYFTLDYALAFYSTGTSEVDLILSRGRHEEPIAIEIKSNPTVHKEDLAGLELFSKEYPKADLYCLSTNTKPHSIELSTGKNVKILPFQDGIVSILGVGEQLKSFYERGE
jgi:predicted AAA+ superfamily ATPase